jgi:hypothetical protein
MDAEVEGNVDDDGDDDNVLEQRGALLQLARDNDAFVLDVARNVFLSLPPLLCIRWWRWLFLTGDDKDEEDVSEGEEDEGGVVPMISFATTTVVAVIVAG